MVMDGTHPFENYYSIYKNLESRFDILDKRKKFKSLHEVNSIISNARVFSNHIIIHVRLLRSPGYV